MGKKRDYAYVKNYIEKYNYTLISPTYISAKHKLDLICDKGHKCSISFNKFSLNRRCKTCGYINISNKKLLKYNDIQQEFKAKKFTLITKKYTGKNQKLKFICDNNHQYEKTLVSFRSTPYCYKCKLKANKFNNNIINTFKKEGYTVTSTYYINCYTYIDYICPANHSGTMRYNNFQQGKRCPICSQQIKTDRLTFNYIDIKKFIERNGYKLMSKIYKNANTKLIIKCPENHTFYMTYAKFKIGQRCPYCKPKYSKAEKEIAGFIKRYINIDENNRDIIAPYELDIYISGHNIAIEYCGLYWHNDDHVERKYHRIKLDKCNSKGIRLITIFEDEWIQKQDIVKSKLLNILGLTKNTIYARNCTIKEIDSKVVNDFYENNHLQGKTRAKIHLGLFYEDELVQAMSIGSPSRHHTHSGLEMKRFATKLNYNVVGGGSKLLKYILNKLDKPLRTHNDLRWGKYNDNVYDKLGFTKINESKYTPHYILNGNRYRNQGLRKTKEERLTGLTEYELRKRQGYTRIWDCGHQTWEVKYV